MNVLITGALGHIGSKLIRSLPEAYNIYAVDDFMTNRYCSLFNLNRDIKFVESDFINIPHSVIKSADVIIHLAAVTDATNSFKNIDIEDINVTKTKTFIDICKAESNAKFIFPSSTSVYGVSTDVVVEDDYTLLNPQSPYAAAKIEIENHIKLSGIKNTIFRFGTIFGISPGIRFHTAINKFCYQASFNQSLTIWKQNYNQKRPYLGINDCVRAINLAITNHNTTNHTFNVITDNYVLYTIVDYIRSTSERKININLVDTPLLNQYSYNVSIDKFKKMGFIPKDDIKKEIQKTMGLFDNEI
jgi:nucleoside-diphosphate-sugar epimerase